MRPLQVKDTVQVQNQVGNHPSRRDITGNIVETRPFDQYVVKIHGSGRLTTRNRKFLKQITPYCPAPSPSNFQEVPETAKVDTPSGRKQTTAVEVPVPELTPDLVDVDTSTGLGTVPIAGEQDVGATPTPSPAIPSLEGAQLGLRKSTRSSKVPDRLQVTSWKGQTYDTACQSVGYSDCLHPVSPDGGEGINFGTTLEQLCLV